MDVLAVRYEERERAKRARVIFISSFRTLPLAQKRTQDKLMTHPPEAWFSSLVSLEVLAQLPFFLLALYALWHRPPRRDSRGNDDRGPPIRGDGPFRSLCLIYGSSTATTLVPIFATLLTDGDTTAAEKGMLLGFYLPYFIFPVWLVVIASCEENVFGSDHVGKKTR